MTSLWFLNNKENIFRFALIVLAILATVYLLHRLYSWGKSDCNTGNTVTEQFARIAQLEAEKNQMRLYAENLFRSQAKDQEANDLDQKALNDASHPPPPASAYMRSFADRLRVTDAARGTP